MQTEYRVVMTVTFDTVAKRDAFYTVVRNALLNWLNNIPLVRITATGLVLIPLYHAQEILKKL